MQLFSPALANTPQVVVVSKADLPHVADRMPHVLGELKGVLGHARIIGISAASGLNVGALKRRTYKLLREMGRRAAERGAVVAAGGAVTEPPCAAVSVRLE